MFVVGQLDLVFQALDPLVALHNQFVVGFLYIFFTFGLSGNVSRALPHESLFFCLGVVDHFFELFERVVGGGVAHHLQIRFHNRVERVHADVVTGAAL